MRNHGAITVKQKAIEMSAKGFIQVKSLYCLHFCFYLPNMQNNVQISKMLQLAQFIILNCKSILLIV